MGTNTLQADRVTGEIIEAADVNEFRTALTGTVIPRDVTTRAASHESDDLGSASASWRNGYFKNLVIDGSSLNVNTIKTAGIDIVVSSTGGYDYTTISAAINAASDGDVILVLNGTYSANISITDNLIIYGQGIDTKITGDITISGNCILEKLNFSDSTKKISFGYKYDEEPPEGGAPLAMCFIERCWLCGTYDDNLFIPSGQSPTINIHFYEEEE